MNTLIYRFSEDGILNRMIDALEQAVPFSEEKEKCWHTLLGEAISYGIEKGYSGNLWKCLFAEELAMNENAYAKCLEYGSDQTGSIETIVSNDVAILWKLFHYDFTMLGKIYRNQPFSYLSDFSGNLQSERSSFSCQVISFENQLSFAEDSENMKEVIKDFYKNNGVGMLGMYKAFRISDTEEKTTLVPIAEIEKTTLSDLVGYEIAKKKLIANTEAFVEGRPANNCLLFGDAGTGKSSSVKAILNQYHSNGLRMIEVYKHQFHKLNDLIEQIKERNYKFIIYMDDLSFEDFEIEYKYLKGIIEGGLAKKSNQVLIYATSNRRHLIRESYSDKEEIREDMHTSDTVQEKLSLVARFGVSIFFCRPNKKEFQKIVTTLAKKYQIQLSEETLLYEANKWELAHGGLSGRTAKQFIDYIRGENSNEH